MLLYWNYCTVTFTFLYLWMSTCFVLHFPSRSINNKKYVNILFTRETTLQSFHFADLRRRINFSHVSVRRLPWCIRDDSGIDKSWEKQDKLCRWKLKFFHFFGFSASRLVFSLKLYKMSSGRGPWRAFWGFFYHRQRTPLRWNPTDCG